MKLLSMNNQINISYNFFKAIYSNYFDSLQLNHVFSNASEFINIEKRGFSFIHINKNGGSTIESIIGIKDQLHLPYSALEDMLGAKRANSLITFSMVRNPFDRVVSQYHYRLQNNQYGLKDQALGFNEFCKKAYRDKDLDTVNYPLMFRTQYDWLKNYKGDISHINYIGKFEFFNESIDDVLKLLNLNQNKSEMPHKRQSKRKKDWISYYDDQSLEIIYSYFKNDFEAFDYKAY